MSLLEGATATSPMETAASLSKQCSKVMPLLMVLSRPPEALATNQQLGSVSETAMAVMRPPIEAGPIDRQVNALVHSAGKNGTAASAEDGWPFFFRSFSRLDRSAICRSISAICCSRLGLEL